MFIFELFVVLMITYLQRKHFLLALLSLELCVVWLYSMIMVSFGESYSMVSVAFSLVYLGISVCECMIGLGLLVSRASFMGSDSVSGLFSLSH